MLEFIQSADEAILAFLRGNVCNSILNYIMIFFTYLGEEGIIWIIFGIIMLLLPKYRKHGVKLALGLLVMLLVKADSIREVIAFPKVKDASCLMTEAPTRVEQKQLDELAIALVEEAKEIEE